MTNLVKRKLRQSFFGNAVTRYGLEHEGDAVQEYCARKSGYDPLFAVRPSGLVVSTDYPFLACSLDGIVLSSTGRGLLEVKCPFRCRNRTLLDVATASKSTFCLVPEDGKLCLSRRHTYYYQV